jgi:hypothetical protein
VPQSSESYNLYVLRPDLARQWHPTKNGSLSPKDVGPGSSRKVWWLCENGHWWLASVRDRTRGRKCTFCRQSIRRGDQRMADLKPELLKEWHPTRNGDLRARDLPSNFKGGVWWICERGHEWKAAVPCRLAGKTCPLCSQLMPRTPSLGGASTCSVSKPAGDNGPSLADNRLSKLREEDTVSHQGTELRRSKRYLASAVVMIEENRLGILGYARLENFSAGGLMLGSDFALNPGQLIKLRFDKPMHFSASSVVSSRVIWCRSLESPDDMHSRFGVGVSLT